MPFIENERKYVLSPKIETVLKEENLHHIRQAYLPSVDDIAYRIREVTKQSKVKRIFTIKIRNVDGTNTEVEFPLSKDDFDVLYSKADRSLKKRRYCIPYGNEIWEIDVFMTNDGKSYFWMAEIELPEEQPEPKNLPDIIKKHLIFEVPLTDARFSSRKISNIKYAQRLYKHVKEKGDYDEETTIPICS